MKQIDSRPHGRQACQGAINLPAGCRGWPRSGTRPVGDPNTGSADQRPRGPSLRCRSGPAACRPTVSAFVRT